MCLADSWHKNRKELDSRFYLERHSLICTQYQVIVSPFFCAQCWNCLHFYSSYAYFLSRCQHWSTVDWWFPLYSWTIFIDCNYCSRDCVFIGGAVSVFSCNTGHQNVLMVALGIHLWIWFCCVQLTAFHYTYVCRVSCGFSDMPWSMLLSVVCIQHYNICWRFSFTVIKYLYQVLLIEQAQHFKEYSFWHHPLIRCWFPSE